MSSAKRNIQIIYNEVPSGFPFPPKTFEVRHGSIEIEKVTLEKNEVLGRTLWISLDPWLGPMLRDPSAKSFFPALTVGVPMVGPLVAEVMKSNNPEYAIGDVVVGMGGWAEYTTLDPAKSYEAFRKIPDPKNSRFPLSYYVGVFGWPGYAAYTGLGKISEPIVPGQTLFVTAAAGAVGQVVGQYGKALGLRVVGSAGTDQKVDMLLNDLGFDAAFNYKKETDLDAILKESCPQGIDIYFDNVGGKTLDTVIKHCNNKARIPICGVLSQYYRENNVEPIYNVNFINAKNIRMEGFIATIEAAACIEPFSKLIEAGKMTIKEDITEGIQNVPQAFLDVLDGKNVGKAVAHIADL